MEMEQPQPGTVSAVAYKLRVDSAERIVRDIGATELQYQSCHQNYPMAAVDY